MEETDHDHSATDAKYQPFSKVYGSRLYACMHSWKAINLVPIYTPLLLYTPFQWFGSL